MYVELRNLYKPIQVKLLYIAESPPANGSFFYKCDSNLYEALQKAWQKVYGESCGDGLDFLRFFKDKGCYLDDLCLEPINNLNNEDRESQRVNNIDSLSERIGELEPTVIVILLKYIEKHVKIAIRRSGVKTKLQFITPFPAHSNKNKENCISQNARILELLKGGNIL